MDQLVVNLCNKNEVCVNSNRPNVVFVCHNPSLVLNLYSYKYYLIKTYDGSEGRPTAPGIRNLETRYR